jgi:hypothetical protein
MANAARGTGASTTVNSSVRTREYLTVAEVERLMAEARKSGRYGHRDATMILIAFRHGLPLIFPYRSLLRVLPSAVPHKPSALRNGVPSRTPFSA